MNNKSSIASFIGVCVVLVVALVFGSTFTFLCGYLGGWLLKCFVGGPVTTGLNMMLGTITQHTFTPEDIPLFCAIMTTIGGFFTTHVSRNKE